MLDCQGKVIQYATDLHNLKDKFIVPSATLVFSSIYFMQLPTATQFTKCCLCIFVLFVTCIVSNKYYYVTYLPEYVLLSLNVAIKLFEIFG